LKRCWWDNFNDIKESQKWWPNWATLTIQRWHMIFFYLSVSVTHSSHHWCFPWNCWIHIIKSFSMVLMCYNWSFGLPLRSFFFISFSLSSLFKNYNKKRGEKKNKKSLEAYWSFDYNITGTIKKISTRRIQ
jgi:hypothetical protein